MQEDVIRQQLVRYEALFGLMNEILSLDDVKGVAQVTAKGWKFIANVAAWRLVVANEDHFVVLEGSRGAFSIKEIDSLPDWDLFHWQLQIPRIVTVSNIDSAPYLPEGVRVPHASQAQVVHYRRLGRTVGLLTVTARKVGFEELDNKLIRLYGKCLTDQVVNIYQRETSLRIYHRLAHEPKIGTLNKFAITYRLETQLAAAQRICAPLSVIMIELLPSTLSPDYPHQGERILAKAAEHFRVNLRPHESLGYLGDWKFLFILFPSDLSETHLAADRIAASIAQLAFEVSNPRLSEKDDKTSLAGSCARLGLVCTENLQSPNADMVIRLAADNLQPITALPRGAPLKT